MLDCNGSARFPFDTYGIVAAWDHIIMMIMEQLTDINVPSARDEAQETTPPNLFLGRIFPQRTSYIDFGTDTENAKKIEDRCQPEHRTRGDVEVHSYSDAAAA